MGSSRLLGTGRRARLRAPPRKAAEIACAAGFRDRDYSLTIKYTFRRIARSREARRRTTEMKVSAQEEYGLRCMLQLARRQKGGEGHPLTLSEIAREEGLTVPHVAKLIRRLRNSGLVRSVLGRMGGYTLSRDASSVSVAEVLGALG